MTDVEEANLAFIGWVKWARHCQNPRVRGATEENHAAPRAYSEHHPSTDYAMHARIEANNNKSADNPSFGRYPEYARYDTAGLLQYKHHTAGISGISAAWALEKILHGGLPTC